VQERILVVGSGAREHSIGWKVAQHDTQNRSLFFAPGNAGTQQLGTNIDIDPLDTDRLVSFAADNQLTMTIVGPEKPMANGLVNAFNEADLPIFGHTQEAAKLESDKADAILFMRRHGILHPPSEIFTDYDAAVAFVQDSPWAELVIKASGLADGKGVILPHTQEEAIRAIHSMMREHDFGDAGEKIVVQKRILGKEVSVIGFMANEVGFLAPAQDFKRAYDGDLGPNTGGMGVIAPNPNFSQEQLDQVKQEVFIPTMNGLREEGRPARGIVYAGLMIDEDDEIYTLEFNMRFGDPETQVQLRMLKSDLLISARNTNSFSLSPSDYESHSGAVVGVVIAAPGYPGKYSKGKEIYGLDKRYAENIVIFHANTKREGETVRQYGGRTLTLTATAETIEKGASDIYNMIGEQGIHMEEGEMYRADIIA
jgi:phosphoribosylamine--glycine ligase